MSEAGCWQDVARLENQTSQENRGVLCHFKSILYIRSRISLHFKYLHNLNNCGLHSGGEGKLTFLLMKTDYINPKNSINHMYKAKRMGYFKIYWS